MRFDIHHHFPDTLRIFDMNAALSSELSVLSDTLAAKDSMITSLSSALDAAAADQSTAISSAVSAAVEAEDSAIAASISAAIG